MRVLHIEDDETTCFLVEANLGPLGVEIDKALNLNDARALLKETYDLIISDLGFYGHDIVKEAVEKSKGAPVIVYSCRDFEVIPGVKRYFVKLPGETKKMVRFIRELLGI